jgi:hypothetical protein
VIWSRAYVFPPYILGNSFLLCPAPLSQVRCCGHWSPNDELPSTPLFIAVPSWRWRADICLPSFTNSCDVVMGKEPRLWSCPPAAATESFNQDTTDSLEPSHVNSPLSRGTRWVVLLSPRVWKGCHRDGGTRDWYLMHYSTPSKTGGQKHTHTHHTVVVLCYFFLIWQEIVFGTYVISVQYSCAVVSVFLLWQES